MEKFDLKAPLNLNLLALKLGGLWPNQFEFKHFYKYYFWFVFLILVVLQNLSQAINFYFIYNQLKTVTLSVVVFLNLISGMTKFIIFYKKIATVGKLMQILESDLFQPSTAKQRNVLRNILTQWRRIYLIFFGLTCCTLVLWDLFPSLNQDLRVLPFLAWYPYDSLKTPFYEITYLYQSISVGFIALLNINVDTFICALIMLVSAQSDLLCQNLQHLQFAAPRRVKSFRDCVKHHQEILRFVKLVDHFLSFISFVQFLISVLAICATMFQLTLSKPFTTEFYKILFTQNAVLTQIFIYCWFGNELIFKSDQISNCAFHSLFWITSSAEKRKDLLFFLIKSREPLDFKAIHFFRLSLVTFTAVLKTSWSYFALLRKINNN